MDILILILALIAIAVVIYFATKDKKPKYNGPKPKGGVGKKLPKKDHNL